MTFKYRKQTHAKCECCTRFSQEHKKWDCVFIRLPVCVGTRGLPPPPPCVSPPILCICRLRTMSSMSSGQVLLRSEGWRTRQQRRWWTKCAVESGTQCPKSLQEMRDLKCFTVVYSEQLIKKKVQEFYCSLFFFQQMTANSLSFDFFSFYETLLPHSFWLVWCGSSSVETGLAP